jgi:hypothetical protein
MRMRFNRYFHLGARFQAYLFPLFVDERIFDSDFPIKVIRSFDSDLGFFGIAWHYRLDDFFDCGWQGGSSFFAHGVQFSRIVASSAPKTTAPFQPNLSDIPDAPADPLTLISIQLCGSKMRRRFLPFPCLDSSEAERRQASHVSFIR